ncbi:hypothetical protein [Amycolatopsis albispora]|uniref:Uncharacterized protein n=1 Tax=Amycolatopsis albispora TaxID=1804986 RepID=A0A344L5A2_9PSEU|nr:hypothetical protein [Amycolatopsis albispora]AXB43226.1 hypothetical protein A4R43_12260 [Amycolatopsis albispora]
MGGARHEMHGDPEAMRAFAERVAWPDAVADVAVPPAATPCPAGMSACAGFTAADLAATLSLGQFLAETRDDLATLKAAAAVAADDYEASDQAGARAVLGVVLEQG